MDITDICKGEIGVVIGNGRSLLDVPREFLEKYPNFGINHIYLLKPPFQPTYYMCIDTCVLTQYAHEIYHIASKAEIAFLSTYHATDKIPETRKLYRLSNRYIIEMDEGVFKDAGDRVLSGWTGAYVALRIAYYMGFRTILLVGIDHDAKWGHFCDNYPEGDKTDENRLQNQREYYEIANRVYQKGDRHIYNLSPSSKLDTIFTPGSIDEWL